MLNVHPNIAPNKNAYMGLYLCVYVFSSEIHIDSLSWLYMHSVQNKVDRWLKIIITLTSQPLV